MAVRLRLTRFGRLNHPTYRVCATEGYFGRDSRVIETLGYYLPKAIRVEEQCRLNVERAKYWLSVGAKPSETVTTLLVSSGVELPTKAKRKKRKKRKAKPFAAPRRLGTGRKAKAKWRSKHEPAATAGAGASDSGSDD